MSDNITVAIKVRPLIKREQDERQPIQWAVGENSITQIIDPEKQKLAETGFQFDYIFDMDKTNQDVFDSIAKPIVEAALKGFNGTIFAYGQTGSGKTYTMLGTKQEIGVIPLVVNYIFEYIQNDPDKEYLLRISYVEIYNEKINDLLDTTRGELKIKEDLHGQITVDCKEEVGTTPQSILQLMRKGEKNRRTGETNMNERSSRSHTIFRITIESCEKADPDTTAKEAQLNLIDLAGSERARDTGATGARFNEGCNINKSLSALSLVIKQLSESQLQNNKFVNFRDSKLTRILQSSLGGNALTTVICAVTPAAVDETQCTLNFALRAKGIKNKPKVNDKISENALLKRVRAQKEKLEDAVKKKTTQLEEVDRELQYRIKLLKAHIISGKTVNIAESNMKARRRTWAGRQALDFAPEFGALPTIAESDDKDDLPGDDFSPNEDEVILDGLVQTYHDRTLDGHNQSFENRSFNGGLPIEAFELQLMIDQQEKEKLSRLSSASDDYATTLRRVTVRKYSDDDVHSSARNLETRARNSISISKPPDTPNAVLRKRIAELQSKYDELCKFTTMERQVFQDDETMGINHIKYENNLAFVTKSLGDSEQMCLDIKKSYAELQSEHAMLQADHKASVENCEMLSEQVKSLTLLQDTVASLEGEKNEIESKYNETLRKLKDMEEKSSTYEFEMELIKQKHKNREKELESSLNLAWQEFVDPREKEKLTNIVHLQSVISELNTKVTTLEAQLKPEATTENDNLTKKLLEIEGSLKKSEEDKFGLLNQIDELSRGLEEKSKSEENINDLYNILNIQIEEHKKQIQELELEITKKDAENNASIDELTKRIQELEQINENQKEQLTSNECLKSELEQKTNELMELNVRFEELKHTHETVVKNLEENNLQLTVLQEELKAAKDVHSNSVLQMEIDEIVENNEAPIENKNENEVLGNELKSGIGHTHEEDNFVDERNNVITELKKMIEEKEKELLSSKETIDTLLVTVEKLQDQIGTMQTDTKDVRIHESSLNEANAKSVSLCEMKPINTLKATSSKLETTQQDKETSSIFANSSYFDNMDVSIDPSETVGSLYLSQNHSEYGNHSRNSTILELKLEPHDTTESSFNVTCTDLINRLTDKTPDEMIQVIKELYAIKNNLEEENARLTVNLKSEIRKFEEIEKMEKDFNGLKSDMEKLQNTILVLTSENEERTGKLEAEKHQTNILQSQLNDILTEKQALVEKIAALENEIEQISAEYKKKIDLLTTENDELSSDLIDKIEQLDNMKNSKFIDFEHECSHKEKLDYQIQRNQILENENANLSKDLMDKIDELNNIEGAYEMQKYSADNVEKTHDEDSNKSVDNYQLQIKSLEAQVIDLKSINIKLRDLKLPSCSECSKLSELSLNRRTLRSEIKIVERKLQEYDQKFKKECADVEILDNKIKGINMSYQDETFNESFIDGANVSYLQDCIQCLQTELTKVSSIYKEKCSEEEQTKDDNVNDSITTLNESISKTKKNNQSELNHLAADYNKMQKRLDNFSESLQKLKNRETDMLSEIDNLKIIHELLEEKLSRTEILLTNTQDEKSSLEKDMDILKSENIDLRSLKCTLETEIEALKKDNENYQSKINELRQSLQEVQDSNTSLQTQLEMFKTTANEQDDLKDILEELQATRKCITNEMASLDPKTNVTNMPAPELFATFLKAIMNTQKEIVQTMIRRTMVPLEEEKKQLEDQVKRKDAWGKELEADNGKLQSDLTKEEEKNACLATKISMLESTLLDSEHEKQLLNEKMNIMETDFNALQAELEKYSGSHKNDSICASHQRDKQLQDVIDAAEMEHKAKLTKFEKNYKGQIEELTNALEISKTKIMEYKSTIEGLEVNGRQLQSIVDMKTNDLTKAQSTIQNLEKQLAELSDVYNQINEDNQVKTLKIEEITGELKNRSDLMSQYKTKLEMIGPENEMLKVQLNERQLRLERYKSEMEHLEDEKNRQYLLLKDELNSEEIKSAGLSKQVTEITNRYTQIQSEFEKFKTKCEELEAENERLCRKIRNSTSKLTAERTVEELTETNGTLKKNLEGAYNRITELQKSKTQLEKDYIELQGQFKLACYDTDELKSQLANYKAKVSNNGLDLPEKYNNLILEKNQIALELEAKRSIVIQYETTIQTLKTENEELKVKNTELDEEMDDIVGRSNDMDRRIDELSCQNHDLKEQNDAVQQKLQELKAQLETETMRVEVLRRENIELKSQSGDKSGRKSTSSSRNNSPTPSTRSRQRRNSIFNENRSLELAEQMEVDLIDHCQCDHLRKTVMKLEKDVAVKNATINSLEMQKQIANFPLQKQIQKLEEYITAYKRRNELLTNEIKKLNALNVECQRCNNWKVNQREISTQTKSQSQQPPLSLQCAGSGIVQEEVMQYRLTKLEKDKQAYKTALSKARLQVDELIQKTEELDKQLKQCQQENITLRCQMKDHHQQTARGASIPESNFKNAMKENVPTNQLETTQVNTSYRQRFF